MTKRTQELEAHLTRLLGPPSRLTAARDPETNHPAPFAVALFEDVPAKGAFTLASSGISELELRSDGEKAREEILFCAWNRFRDESLDETFFSVGNVIAETGTIVHPGLLYELPRTVSNNTVMHHLFAYEPTYFDESLATLHAAGDTIEIIWLIPLHEDEANYMEEHGAEAFLERVAELDPDLLDLRRPSIV